MADKNCESLKTRKRTIVYVELRCEFCGLKKRTTNTAATTHIKYCQHNPNKQVRKPHPPITDEARKKMSESAKRAFKNGNHSTWKSRTECNRSYPERWFISVIKNEFNDKNYVTELPVGKWFLDFAWKEKMRYIEIDGQQHQRYEERKNSDIEKDNFCKNLGWSCLRLSWEFIMNNKQRAIEIAKNFIDNGEKSEIVWESKVEKKQKQREELIKQGRIDSRGNPNCSALPMDTWNKRLELINNSGVDLLKFGWLIKVMKITGLSKKEVYNTIKKFNIDVYKKHLS